MDNLRVASVFKQGPNHENWDYYIGKKYGGEVIEKIEYHQPQGEGDAHYCDIIYTSGNVDRIFRPDSIEFIKEATK